MLLNLCIYISLEFVYTIAKLSPEGENNNFFAFYILFAGIFTSFVNWPVPTS